MKYYNERMDYLKSLLGNKCAKCGETKNLQFDHIDKETKLFTIGRNWSYSLEVLLIEISKCQLLCKSCHKEKNKIDNGESVHGNYSRYKHYKCRCDLCRATFNRMRKVWRLRAKLRKFGG